MNKESENVFDLYSPLTILDFVMKCVKAYSVEYNDITGWEVLLGIAEWGIGEGLKML
jgi:hypothetical protein